MLFCVTFMVCLAVTRGSVQLDEDVYLRFPEGFTVGAGGSAYQIEGGWNASDKGESIWDRGLHTQPSIVVDGSNGDIACDSYHKYKEDVKWVKKIGLDHYRFSISWSRVLPNGFADLISQDGLRYYHNLIDELIANDIEPIVSLYHWDHPQILEDMGGWTNESMVTWFTEYANVIFRELGPKVKVFSTLNEPHIVCGIMYAKDMFAPNKQLNASAAYLCGHNALKAHARTYHLYDQEYRSTQHGKIGIITVCPSYLPKNPNETLAAEISFQFTCGWMSHPIYIGDYPQVFKTHIAELNKTSDPLESRFPELSPEWIQYINGTSDYYGLNYYTSVLVEFGSRNPFVKTHLFWNLSITQSHDPSWEKESTDKPLRIVPEGFGELLRKIKREYNNPPVYVMENGIGDIEPFNDYKRIKYIYSHMKELLLAVHRDGCNVQKYTYWSLMDNFEWIDGFTTIPMGLLNVNFSSPDRNRAPKLSASWLQNVMRTRKLQPVILPPTVNSTVQQ